MLQIADYKKTYAEHPVLSIPALQLPGGTYWLKGENGAGKTTLLKSIAGMIPFEGEIVVDEINLRKNRMAYTKVVSFSEAEPVYPAFLTGRDLLQFYTQTKGRLSPVGERFKQDAGIDRYLEKKIGVYSSGMLKKLSLLLALAGEPKWVLFDEPFVTLDHAAVEFLKNTLQDCHRQGIAVLISSHQQLNLSIPVIEIEIRNQTIEHNFDAVVTA